MTATLLLLGCLFISGLFIVSGLPQIRHRFFVALLFSLLNTVTSWYVCWLLDDPLFFAKSLLFLFLGSVVILWTCGCWHARSVKQFWIKDLFKSSIYTDLGIVLIYTFYIVIAGPYLEIPADVFLHLGSINEQQAEIENGNFLKGNPWYFFLAYSLYVTGENITDLVTPFSAFVGSIFLLGVRYFSRAVGINLGWANIRLEMFSLMAVIVTFIYFGTGLFSYVRYYTFAPAPLCYLLFIGTGLYLCDVKKWPTTFQALASPAIFVSCSIFITYTLHKQEALFIIAITLFFGAVLFTTHITRRIKNRLTSRILSLLTYLGIFIGCTVLAGMGGGFQSPKQSPLIGHTVYFSASPNFSDYVNNHPDLLAVYNANTGGQSKAAWGKQHYCDYGHREGRTSFGLTS